MRRHCRHRRRVLERAALGETPARCLPGPRQESTTTLRLAGNLKRRPGGMLPVDNSGLAVESAAIIVASGGTVGHHGATRSHAEATRSASDAEEVVDARGPAQVQGYAEAGVHWRWIMEVRRPST